MRRTAFLAAAAVLFSTHAFALSMGDSLGLSPHWNWKTIETEHFRVTFPSYLEETAQKEANYLEEAHTVLSPKLYWQPWYRTQILVIDNADLANGLTSPVDRFGLVLWATPPDPWYSTAYYDDWLRLLAFHEYTHMLNMDNVQGGYVPLRWLLGDVLLPNSAWPTWMLEGLAVYMETRFTHAGRGRSPYYEMILRAAVNEQVLGTSRFYALDQFNGDAPYNPAGEAYYLFGYELMNQLSHEHGEDTLGAMSLASAGRFPFFINGNLNNIAGTDWYETWDHWVAQTRKRMDAQLKRIRSRPVTRLETVSPPDGSPTIGPAPSPDGKWLAYTSDTTDRRSGLYLMDLASHHSRRVDDKDSGAQAAFTLDSRTVVYSAVERYDHYYQFSDLEAYDLASGRSYSLTHGLRARDPDLSPDGKWAAFTLTDRETTGLAAAPLLRDDHGKLKLGEIRRFPAAASRYDRVSAPRFARDGRRIVYYSVHRNGHVSEELMALNLDTGAISTLVANGRFNRYPAPAPDGGVYFISDLTGVDNLYLLPASPGAQPKLASNVASGLATPVVGPQGELYAAAYFSAGWSISKVLPLGAPVRAEDVTVAPPPAPAADEQSTPHASSTQHDAKDYSPFPSLWPRQWLILPEIYPDGAYLQTNLSGFDAIDRHEYQGALGYNTQIPKLDWAASYSNRSLGPTLSIGASQATSTFSLDTQGVTTYTRKDQYVVQLAYPVLWTYSSLTPAVSAGGERDSTFWRGTGPGGADSIYVTPFVPRADLSFVYTDAESSRLAISPEEGRTLAGGIRLYADPALGSPTWKGVFKGSEYLRLFGHTVLVPSVKGAWASDYDPDYGDANAVAQGRQPGLLPNPLTAVFDPVKMRGYPSTVYYSRAVATGALDLRFPIGQVFRGWGTNPFFLDNIYGFVFGEASCFPLASGAPALPSAGGGLTANTELLRIPVGVTIEVDQGFKSQYGGKTDATVFFSLGSLGFF